MTSEEERIASLEARVAALERSLYYGRPQPWVAAPIDWGRAMSEELLAMDKKLDGPDLGRHK